MGSNREKSDICIAITISEIWTVHYFFFILGLPIIYLLNLWNDYVEIPLENPSIKND